MDPSEHRLPDGTPYTVREATPADAGAIGVLFAIRRERPNKVGHYTGMVTRILAGIRQAPDRRLMVVAEARGSIVGHARAAWFEPPEDAPEDVAPAGWYLLGVSVHPEFRRRGVGAALTRARMAWLGARADTVWYFRDADNEASDALHAPYGFVPVTTAFSFPGTLDPSVPMVLLRADLSR